MRKLLYILFVRDSWNGTYNNINMIKQFGWNCEWGEMIISDNYTDCDIVWVAFNRGVVFTI